MQQKKALKPIAVANGDGGTGRGAVLVLRTIFKDFPTVDVPMDVKTRIGTKDACIDDAVKAFIECGSGFKNSTASNNKEIKNAGYKSANIIMRSKMGVFAMMRFLQGSGGRYEELCGVLRYGCGGIYDEKSCEVKEINGAQTAVITQHLNLDNLRPFAELALMQAKKYNLHLILASKPTISKSQTLFTDAIENVWKEAGLIAGRDKDYHLELTDMAMAYLPVIHNEGTNKGGFLLVADNENGDTGSDIVDHQNGKNLMGSEVYCIQNSTIFSFQELPGGTADKMETGELVDDNFFNPSAIILALAGAFEKVNPDYKPFFEAVRKETLEYLADDNYVKDTEFMLQSITERVREFEFAE